MRRESADGEVRRAGRRRGQLAVKQQLRQRPWSLSHRACDGHLECLSLCCVLCYMNKFMSARAKASFWWQEISIHVSLLVTPLFFIHLPAGKAVAARRTSLISMENEP